MLPRFRRLSGTKERNQDSWPRPAYALIGCLGSSAGRITGQAGRPGWTAVTWITAGRGVGRATHRSWGPAIAEVLPGVRSRHQAEPSRPPAKGLQGLGTEWTVSVT